uniref:Uncharacterized protein n=1 Tax=Candidatus Kentrum sp. LPFa TaxID=2126335 RepID=A0A450X9G7_9GAMM|nr:MAG: hypothetical protein BECKLPF1236A_GA0070988_100209 [Candidatus Kentron sp. LPFa]VFK25841.1 MAG: hypothetical protein BECKLPF1236C_GA0070990_1002610 [Candidatus Kentron sp. LPFa]
MKRQRRDRCFFGSPGSENPKNFVFHAQRFLDTAFLENEVAVQALTQVAEHQKRKIFWGLLQRTPVNAQASALPAIEFGRRIYLNHPEVIRLRFAPVEADELPKMVVNRFAEAVNKENVDTVAALLFPGDFTTEEEVGISPQAISERYIFAERLIKGRNWKREDLAFRKTDNILIWKANALSLKLVWGDGLPYVSSASFENELASSSLN